MLKKIEKKFFLVAIIASELVALNCLYKWIIFLIDYQCVKK